MPGRCRTKACLAGRPGAAFQPLSYFLLRIKIMKTKKIDALHVWKQLDDVLAPRLRLTPTDRVVYEHLLRHSRFDGKRRLLFSILGVAPKLILSHGSVR